MGEQGWLRELAWGAVSACVIPMALSVLWGRLWRAGIITGWSLAALLHITIVLATLTALFQGMEWLARVRRRFAARPDTRPDTPQPSAVAMTH